MYRGVRVETKQAWTMNVNTMEIEKIELKGDFPGFDDVVPLPPLLEEEGLKAADFVMVVPYRLGTDAEEVPRMMFSAYVPRADVVKFLAPIIVPDEMTPEDIESN